MLWTWGQVWCCLATVEKAVASSLLAYFFSLAFYIDKADFDLLWAASDPLNNFSRKMAFIGMFKLVSSTRIDEEENVIDIWAMNYPFWLVFATYSLTPGLACPDPCKLIPPWV